MDAIQAFILGIIQGLTEFLPVSSSGHIEIGKHLLGVDISSIDDDIAFTVVVHGATVLSTICVFWKDIWKLLQGLFQFTWNDETKYIAKIAMSMIPIAIVGLFFKDYVEEMFSGGLLLVGCCLIFTAALLAFTYYAKAKDKEISFKDAFIIGIAQTVAVLPGVSRSGSTIATGLLLGNKKTEVARFSFLMVLVPILGENLLSVLDGDLSSSSIGAIPLIVGFIAAFISGLLACKLMISIVNKGKLIYFAAYCLLVGAIAVIFA
ncbi:MAG: undecaprenyl-diphosphate phosphatase [Mangrovibacterium sp.]